ncbi:MAG: FAD binding domain-containing protein [Sandaracinobacteroides sp.]
MLDFRYSRPDSLAQAVALLAADSDAQPLSGGQTLLPVLRSRLAAPSRLVDTGLVGEMKGIVQTARGLELGAGETHAAIAGSAAVRAAVPALAALAGGIGDPQVRNRGTLGGSIANNDPAACYPSAMLALGARMHTDRRVIDAADFFTGLFTTALLPGELLIRIELPACATARYVKLANAASRFALVGVFHADTAQGHRLGVTGAGTGVFRWSEGERHLDAGGAPDALMQVPLDQSRFTGDLHGSAAYRQHLVRVAAKQALGRGPVSA